MHSHGMGLHDSGMRVHIYDQSRQVVALAMHQPERVVAFHARQPEGLPERVGGLDAFGPESLVDDARSEGQHAHGDIPDLVMPRREETMVGAIHLYHVAFRGVALDRLDGSGEHPWVETQERFLLLGLQKNFTIFHLCLIQKVIDS